jgi:prepilin-type N-terminal cleavage/methylation domain-containing protein
MAHPVHLQKGFSLVELSIVLVILGLLTGGILTGQSLIKAAELRAVTTEVSHFQAAVHTFQQKYFALPGDLSNATSFWGVFGTGTCPTGSGAGTQTCNGDGDGIVEGGVANQAGEIFLFWQHLANAGLIEGAYTGKAGSGSTWDIAGWGINAPGSKLSNAGWITIDHYTNSGYANDNTWYGNFQFGAIENTWGNVTPVLTTEEAWNIDKKIDDGRPQKGNVWAGNWSQCTNSASSADVNGSYQLSTTGTVCGLMFNNNY